MSGAKTQGGSTDIYDDIQQERDLEIQHETAFWRRAFLVALAAVACAEPGFRADLIAATCANLADAAVAEAKARGRL